MEIKLIRTDGAVKVLPAPSYVTQYLHYYRRSMELDRYQPVTVSKKVSLYTIDPADNGVVTLQGFFKKIQQLVTKHGDLAVVEDHRSVLPEIDWERVKRLHPRDYQIPHVVNFLQQAATESGIVRATGGFGKTHMQMMTYAAFHTLETVLAVPTRQIFNQTYSKFIEHFPEKNIGRMGNGYMDLSHDITISTFKSLGNCALERCKLLLIDEIQGTTGDQISELLVSTSPTRIFGYTATDTGLFNNADKVIKGLFGERLIDVEYQEAEQADAVVPGVVYMVDMPDNILVPATTLSGKLSQGIKNCQARNQLISRICSSIPNNWQTIVFVDHVMDHLVKLHKEMPAGTRFVHRESNKGRAGKYALSAKQQKEVIDSFCNNEFQFLIATDAFRAGFDVQNCRVVVQASGGTSEVEILQEAFRGSRTLDKAVQERLNVDPKTHFVLIDIMDKHDSALENMSFKRMNIYKQQGWKIHRVRSEKEIKWDSLN